MRRFFKVILYTIGSIIALLLLFVVFLNTPWGKNFVRERAQAFLRSKLKTEVYIGGLGYGLPKFIVLENVLFKDQAKDTLLAVGKLKVDIDMLKLIHKQVDVQQILLEGVHAHIYRNAPDTNFNFTYIINAFTGGPKPDTAKTVKAKDTSSSSSLTINLNRVQFDDIHVRFDDYTGGMRLGLNLDHMELKMKKLDLDNMLFHIKELDVAGLQTTFFQDTSLIPSKPDTSTAKSKMQLIADNVKLERINFQYNDALNKLLFGLNLGALNLQLNKFDLYSNLIDIKQLGIDNTAINFEMGKNTTAPAPIDTVVKRDTTEGWRVVANNIDLKGVNFKMNNNNSPRQPAGIDYNHLDVQNLALQLESLVYTSDSISGDLKHLAVKEQSGLDLMELKTVFNYNPQGATLSKLYLQTSNTILQDHLEVHYPSLDALKTNMKLVQMKINLDKSVIGLHDILVFVPDMKKQELFRKYSNGHLQINATVTGFLNNINISKLDLSGMDNTVVSATGTVAGLPDANALRYNLNIAKLQSSRSDISALVPPSTISSIRLPDRFGITGQVSGTTKDYNTNLYFLSTDGGAYLHGSLAMSPGKGRERYDMVVKTMQLNLGRILKQDSLLGPVTASLTVKGHSFDINTMAAALDGSVHYARIKGYGYHDIQFNGNVAAKKGDIKLTSADTNLHLQMNAHADMSGKYAAAKAEIVLDSIDMQALKLYDSELRMRGVIDFDFPVLNPDYPQGEFVWRNPVITANGHKYLTDSLYVLAKSSADSGQNITADFDALKATVTGRTPLTKIGDIVQDHINRHYAFSKKDSAATAVASKNKKGAKTAKTDTTTIPADYDLNLTASVFDRPLLHGVLPGLTSFDTIGIHASLTPRNLLLTANIPELEYGTTTVDNGKVNVTGTDSAFTYAVTADDIGVSKFKLWYANIHGDLDRNNITTNISISDSVKKERFALAADYRSAGDTQIIQMEPGLKLDYKNWQVAQPNKIALTKDGFYVQNFSISDSTNQYIKINSDEPRPNVPVKVDISNFLLANITDIISSSDTLLANGLLGGNITLEKIKPTPQISGDLNIQNLSVLGDTVGNLQLQVNNKEENAINAQLAIKGNGNDIGVAGNYYLQNTNGNDFNFDLNVGALSLASFQGLAMNQIKNSSGYVRGKLTIQGTTSSPQITGELRTDQLATTVSMLNSYYKMPNEKIEFTADGISFNNFSIYDSAGNKAVLTGSVSTADLSNISLNMHVKANNWRAIHSSAKDNKTFYGDLYLTTNLDVQGTPSAPNVDGDIHVLKGTKLTVVTPESEPQIESSKGIVAFVNMKDSASAHVLMPHPKDTTKKKVKLAAGSNINVNLSVDKSAYLSMIIDQASGDFISVQGDASLNASVAPGGTIGLTGNYELHDGAYQLNYNFIKRKFKIKDGSTITFAGDPVKGTNLDITAIYEANISPYDLVSQLESDQSQLNYFKQNLPFSIELHMKGQVMQPTLTFDIVLPENKIYPLSADQIELVQGRLNQVRQDTSELNKQVFAVLILNRFVGDDPFTSGAGGGGLGATAMASVSRFIGEQLNQFANKLIKGVDLSVDLASSEDYTTGDMRQRTDLNIAASKQLLNDRLKVTVGNDFELEGPQTNDNSQSNLIPSNLSADYLLSADGRYTVQGYRKNYDEGVLQGYVTETGVNFIVSLDYNHFRNIFKKKKNNKKEQTSGASK